MSTTIKGAVHEATVGFDGERSIIFHNPAFLTNPDALPATLIIGEEPLFTEAQVKAMLKDILFHIADYGYVHDKFKEQSAKHGIGPSPSPHRISEQG